MKGVLEMIINFHTLTPEQVAICTGYAMTKLNEMALREFGEPLTPRTALSVKNYVSNFLSELRPYLKITKKFLTRKEETALDNFIKDNPKENYKIFFVVICSFNSHLVQIIKEAQQPQKNKSPYGGEKFSI